MRTIYIICQVVMIVCILVIIREALVFSTEGEDRLSTGSFRQISGTWSSRIYISLIATALTCFFLYDSLRNNGYRNKGRPIGKPTAGYSQVCRTIEK